MMNWRVILAYVIFFCSLLINVTAMSHGLNLKELSVLEASSYLFVPLLSYLILKEKIGLRELGAMFLIFFGILVFYV
jgi:drug/metabolite transporter (DMT)-like permease